MSMNLRFNTVFAVALSRRCLRYASQRDSASAITLRLEAR